MTLLYLTDEVDEMSLLKTFFSLPMIGPLIASLEADADIFLWNIFFN